MSELRHLLVIVGIGLVGMFLSRHAALALRRVVPLGWSIAILIYGLQDPSHRYVSLVVALIGLVSIAHFWPLPSAPQQ